MKKINSKEFKAGYKSGILHDINDSLCRDNIRKMELGKMALELAVQSYWQGYSAALRERNIQ